MKKFFLCVALGAGLSPSAWSCADIRLDSAAEALATYPVFDQATATAATDMNICYAATAAQLIDSYRSGKTKAEITSPWWLAVNYSSAFKSEENPDVPFGEPDKALEAVKKDGICSQEDLFGSRPTEDIIRFHLMLKDFYKSLADQKQEPKTSLQKLESLLQKMNFVSDPQALAEISGKALQEKTFILFLRSLFQGKCQGKVKQNPTFEVQRIDVQKSRVSNEQKDQIITETLLKQQPIEVSICSQVLRNPDYFPAENFKRCLRHSVLVVGSRLQDKQCQYLVRDTYGSESCQRLRGAEPWYHPSLECKDGQVWVPQASLLRNTWGMTRVMAKSEPEALNSQLK